MKKGKGKPRTGITSAASSLIAILVGLLAGFMILLISKPSLAVRGLEVIISGGFNNGMKGIGQVLFQATPIILTGLSVGFAFKTGLFNIGAAGQFMVGGFVSILTGVTCEFMGPFHWVFALLCGMLAGGLWAMVPGLFKAYFNVNEVISSIMMNYISLYGINYLIKSWTYVNPETGQQGFLLYDKMKNLSVNVAKSAVIPDGGLTDIFHNMMGNYRDNSSVNMGIVIAIGVAVIMYIILYKTTFGYELRACGFNKEASRYAGINENRSIVLSMTIAGALAGIGGALVYLAPASGTHWKVIEVLATQGFNGIPVALLGLSNPIGIIFSALFIAYINVGGYYLQPLGYMPEIIDIIIGIIIYFSAFSLFVKGIIARILRHRNTIAADAAADDDAVPAMASGGPDGSVDAPQKGDE